MRESGTRPIAGARARGQDRCDASNAPHTQRVEEELHMPLINVKVIEGVFSDDQKRDIVERLTDTMVSIEGENMRQVTWCVVEEVKSGDWGIAGTPLTTEAVKALAAGVPVG
jgi:4-oxalocrotonate tautomerase